MKNKKFNETIINDYISILTAKNFFSYCISHLFFNDKIRSKIKSYLDFSNELLNTYKKIMFKLNLIDLSLAILDKEINFSNTKNAEYLSNEVFIQEKIEFYTTLISSITKNLKSKIKYLGLNNFELDYLNIQKLSEIIL